MPFFLISIKKGNWERDDHVAWLPLNEYPATVYCDLRPSFCVLSVWHIDDDKSNIDNVTTALASTRHGFDLFDCLLFDQSITENAGYKIRDTVGDTPLLDANHWHRDIIELSVSSLGNLIGLIFDRVEKVRIRQAVVRDLIVAAAADNRLDVNKLNENLRRNIAQRLNREY